VIDAGDRSMVAKPPVSAFAAPMLPFPVELTAGPGGLTPEQIADQLEIVSRADRSFLTELNRAASDPHWISGVTVNRLEQLLSGQLRPAARITERLGTLDPQLLHAGISVWLSRREHTGTAARRAARRWGIGDRR
jgi:hypothetical protein